MHKTKRAPELKGKTRKALEAYWAGSIIAAGIRKLERGEVEMVIIEDDIPPECAICGGPLVFLGALGMREHYRCRNCGMGWNFGGYRRDETDHCEAMAEAAEEEHLTRIKRGM